jgi:hypothetical protein
MVEPLDPILKFDVEGQEVLCFLSGEHRLWRRLRLRQERAQLLPETSSDPYHLLLIIKDLSRMIGRSDYEGWTPDSGNIEVSIISMTSSNDRG